jgi:hypothetical protein
MLIVCIFHSTILLELIQVQTRLRGDEVDASGSHEELGSVWLWVVSLSFLQGMSFRSWFSLVRVWFKPYSGWFPFGFCVFLLIIQSICFG